MNRIKFSKYISLSLSLLGLLSLLLLPTVLRAEKDNPNYRSFNSASQLKEYMRWSPGKTPLISAHRGGPMKGFPENAVETFENALTYGPCLIECDVRLTKDKKLVMMHDNTLNRTTTGKGKVSDHTLAQLKKLHLKNSQGEVTDFRIPTFAQVLQWAKGRTVLTVDVKRKVPYQMIIDEVRKQEAEGQVIIIVYSLNAMLKVHRLAPELMISTSVKGVMGAKKVLAAKVPLHNLCAFVGVYEPKKEVYRLLHKKGVSTILGTLHNLDKKAEKRGLKVYTRLMDNGADILSTDNVAMVSKAIELWKDTHKK